MKKILSVLFAAILVLSIAPVSLFASAEGEHTSGIWTYTVEDGYATITKCSKLVNGKITIPETIAGYPLIGWSEFAFAGFRDYELVIPNAFPANLLQHCTDYYAKHTSEVNSDRDVNSLEEYLELVKQIIYCDWFLLCATNAFTVTPGNKYLASVDGILYTKDMTQLIRYPQYKDSIFYSLPTTVDLNKCLANIEDELSPFYNLFGGVTGLTVHISAAQMQNVYNHVDGDIFSKAEYFLAQILGFGLGTATICTDWKNNMILEMFRDIYSDPEFSDMRGIIPDVERCTGDHTPTVKEVTSISVASLPDKTTYTVGESFVKTGLSLNVTYNDGTSSVVTSGFTCTPTTLTKEGSQTITVTYEGKKTTFTVQVKPATVTGISVLNMPAKTTYYVGESFNQSGLTLTATYSDGSTKTITSGIVCTGFSSDFAGTKTITATYDGKSTTFTVTVQPNPSMSIRTPSTSTIKYGYTLILHTQTANLPAGARIDWTVNGSGVTIQPSSDSLECNVQSVSSGSATITAQLVDRNGNALKDASGNAIQSQQTIVSRAGFFQRLAYFFKSLFGGNTTIPQAVKELFFLPA